MLPALPPARSAFTDAALRPLGAPVVQVSMDVTVIGMVRPASPPPSAPPAKKPPLEPPLEPPPSSCPDPTSPFSAGPPLSSPPPRPFEPLDPQATVMPIARHEGAQR